MVDQKLIAKIEELSLDEQLHLMEILIRSISRRTLGKDVSEGSLQRVRGMLKPEGALPADTDLADDDTAYLIRKYS